MDLESKQLRLTTRDIPMQADLGVHLTLTRGDLLERRFEISEATVTVDNAQRDTGEARKGGPWWCSLQLSQGTVVFARPLAAQGAMALKMRDTRPIVAVINELSKPPKWMSLLPEIENVDGTLNLDMGGATTAVDDVDITGESLQILGWLHLAEKKANGRIYVKYKGFAAGIGLDDGKSSLHPVKPREWFDEQVTRLSLALSGSDGRAQNSPEDRLLRRRCPLAARRARRPSPPLPEPDSAPAVCAGCAHGGAVWSWNRSSELVVPGRVLPNAGFDRIGGPLEACEYTLGPEKAPRPGGRLALYETNVLSLDL